MMNKFIYTEQELPQKSDEWLAFRKNGIGASEIPAILGHLPPHWSNDYEIFLQKKGKPKQETTIPMERGTILEESARKVVTHYLNNCTGGNKKSIFCDNCVDKTNIKLDKPVKFEQLTAKYLKFDKIFASFDGVDIDNKLILEIKCPSQSTFTKNMSRKKLPKNYLAQVQTQLMIANSHWGIQKAVFAIFFPEGVYVKDKTIEKVTLKKLSIIEVDLDTNYSEMIEKYCRSFWEMIENNSWNNTWKKDLI